MRERGARCCGRSRRGGDGRRRSCFFPARPRPARRCRRRASPCTPTAPPSGRGGREPATTDRPRSAASCGSASTMRDRQSQARRRAAGRRAGGHGTMFTVQRERRPHDPRRGRGGQRGASNPRQAAGDARPAVDLGCRATAGARRRPRLRRGAGQNRRRRPARSPLRRRAGRGPIVPRTPLAAIDGRRCRRPASFGPPWPCSTPAPTATRPLAFARFLAEHPRDPRAEDAAYLRVIALASLRRRRRRDETRSPGLPAAIPGRFPPRRDRKVVALTGLKRRENIP